MFHQSGGCCDGSAPMCYLKGEVRVGGNDKSLCGIDGCPVYMDLDQFGYWNHREEGWPTVIDRIKPLVDVQAAIDARMPRLAPLVRAARRLGLDRLGDVLGHLG
jgi:Protein of unknown function (DUF779)